MVNYNMEMSKISDRIKRFSVALTEEINNINYCSKRVKTIINTSLNLEGLGIDIKFNDDLNEPEWCVEILKTENKQLILKRKTNVYELKEFSDDPKQKNCYSSFINLIKNYLDELESKI